MQTGVGHTPRCLRRADSGMPHEELTPRSDSSNSPPLDPVTGVTNGVGPVVNGCGSCSNSSAAHSHTSSNSETSSGVHSNASNGSNASQGSGGQRRATSVDDLTGTDPREEPQWRSCSLQRGTQPPTANSTFSSPSSRPGTSQSFSPQYVNHTPLLNGVDKLQQPGCPAVILENPNEATVVIRRRLSRPKIVDPLNPEEPFGRSTNMRMTSFTENSDLRGIQASSATLPHYPTQPLVTYPHCSTMPLPHATHTIANPVNTVGPTTTGGSCGSVTRNTNSVQPPTQHPQQPQQQQQQQQQQLPAHPTMPAHTTLPSHHNGTRIIHVAANPFVKRFPPVQVHSQPWALPGHHTFPQQLQNKLAAPGIQMRHSDRDSANFSMASSGDSDTCLPH